MIDLIQGETLEEMQKLVDKGIVVDMILTDLPYGTTSNKWDAVIPFEPLWELYWKLLKPTGVICLTASQPFTSALLMSQPQYFKHEWIWEKDGGSNFANTVREPMKEHESILVFSKGKWTYNKQMQERIGSRKGKVTKSTFNSKSTNYRDFEGRGTVNIPKLRVPRSIQRFTRERGLHPTQKPTKLFEYLVNTYTNENETVLDNTMGSGTTALACMNLDRNFIGIELEEKYYEVAKKRVEEKRKEKDLQIQTLFGTQN